MNKTHNICVNELTYMGHIWVGLEVVGFYSHRKVPRVAVGRSLCVFGRVSLCTQHVTVEGDPHESYGTGERVRPLPA